MNRTFLRHLFISTIALAALGPANAMAQAPVRVIIGAAAGGALDPYVRTVSEAMGRTLGKTLVVENKPGANGNIAAQMVRDAPADGAIIWVGTQSMTEINPVAYTNLRWSMNDFVPVIKGVAAPLVLITHPSVPAKTLTDLVAYVKANPGKLSYASFSPGTPSHFLGAQMNERFGLDLGHVPYRGSGPQTSDLVAGHALIGFGQLGSVAPQVATGKLNAIAVTGPQRSKLLPEVSTFAELGYNEFTTTVWFGLFLRAGTPDATVKSYVDAAVSAHNDPEIKAKLEAIGFDVVAETGVKVSESIKQQTERWRKLIANINFKVE